MSELPEKLITAPIAEVRQLDLRFLNASQDGGALDKHIEHNERRMNWDPRRSLPKDTELGKVTDEIMAEFPDSASGQYSLGMKEIDFETSEFPGLIEVGNRILAEKAKGKEFFKDMPMKLAAGVYLISGTESGLQLFEVDVQDIYTAGGLIAPGTPHDLFGRHYWKAMEDRHLVSYAFSMRVFDPEFDIKMLGGAATSFDLDSYNNGVQAFIDSGLSPKPDNSVTGAVFTTEQEYGTAVPYEAVLDHATDYRDYLISLNDESRGLEIDFMSSFIGVTREVKGDEVCHGTYGDKTISTAARSGDKIVVSHLLNGMFDQLIAGRWGHAGEALPGYAPLALNASRANYLTAKPKKNRADRSLATIQRKVVRSALMDRTIAMKRGEKATYNFIDLPNGISDDAKFAFDALIKTFDPEGLGA